MPTQKTSIFNENTPGITYAGANVKWKIAKDVHVGSENTVGIYSLSNAKSTLVNKGLVYSFNTAAVYFNEAEKSTVLNKASGAIVGELGIHLRGGLSVIKDYTVENDGSIVSTVYGVLLENTADAEVDNTGEIFGHEAGVYVQRNLAGPTAGAKIKNTGKIDSDFYGILSVVPGLKTKVVNKEGGTIDGGLFSVSSNGGTLSLTNKGKLKADVRSIDPTAKDKVVNEGQIKGIVSLFGGDDTYKNKGGKAGKIYSGDGDDTLIAGKTKDKFVFSGPLNENTNVDRIKKFESGKDTFFLVSVYFAAIPDGVLAGSAFEKGKEADDLSDRIIYHKKTGNLFYDEDGLGGFDQIQIARLDPGQKLAAGDFTVFG